MGKEGENKVIHHDFSVPKTKSPDDLSNIEILSPDDYLDRIIQINKGLDQTLEYLNQEQTATLRDLVFEMAYRIEHHQPKSPTDIG